VLGWGRALAQVSQTTNPTKEPEMTSTEIEDRVNGAEEDGRRSAVQDILIDLADFLKDCPANERAGYQAAIEVIQANYIH
jgi:hypothetical protein